MPTTFQDQQSDPTLVGHADGQTNGDQGPPVPFAGPAPDPRDPAQRLTSLLGAAPVDLGHISREIRAHPDLEALVIRLSGLLVLSPEGSITSVEEAAVVLGTDRLRILVHAWSSLQNSDPTVKLFGKCGLNSGGTPASEPPTQAFAPWTHEMLYIAGVLHCLGLDPAAPVIAPNQAASGFGLRTGQLAGLTDLLVRDFISLIPVLGPAFLNSQQTAIAATATGAHGKESE
jgi:hypothetical protein